MHETALLEIVEYQPQYRTDFERLNREWIEAYFEMEPADVVALTHPEEKILAPGGVILFALWEKAPVGTVALIRKSDTLAELAKMGVESAMRGKNIGNVLMQAALDKARELGFRELMLESNSSLGPAIHLYEKYGFRHETIDETPYKRADVRMSLTL